MKHLTSAATAIALMITVLLVAIAGGCASAPTDASHSSLTDAGAAASSATAKLGVATDLAARLGGLCGEAGAAISDVLGGVLDGATLDVAQVQLRLTDAELAAAKARFDAQAIAARQQIDLDRAHAERARVEQSIGYQTEQWIRSVWFWVKVTIGISTLLAIVAWICTRFAVGGPVGLIAAGVWGFFKHVGTLGATTALDLRKARTSA